MTEPLSVGDTVYVTRPAAHDFEDGPVPVRVAIIKAVFSGGKAVDLEYHNGGSERWKVAGYVFRTREEAQAKWRADRGIADPMTEAFDRAAADNYLATLAPHVAERMGVNLLRATLAELDRVAAEAAELRMDAANYRGKCGACGTANCDMLTDTYCSECEKVRLELGNEQLTADLARVTAERDKLQAFKDWVHAYLDGKGVPFHPPGTHGAEGCRIGDRMDWVFAQFDGLRASTGEDIARGQKACNDGEPCDPDVAKAGLGFAAGYWYSKAKEVEDDLARLRADLAAVVGALAELHDAADVFVADQSGAPDPRCGLVQPVTVAECEALNAARRRAAAVLAGVEGSRK